MRPRMLALIPRSAGRGGRAAAPSPWGSRVRRVVPAFPGAWLVAAFLAMAALDTTPAGAQTPAPGALSLTDAVAAALRSHPAAEGARARTGGAAARLDQARAAWLPFLGAEGTLARFQEPMVVAPLHGFDPHNPPEFDRTLLQGNLSLGYTLFDGGGRSARVRRAEAGEAGAKAGEEGTGMDLAFQVSEAYLAVLTAREVLEASSRQKAALEAERRRTEQFLEEGKAARVDLLRVEAALSRTEAGEISARTELDVALGRLARLTGLAGEEVRGAELIPPRLSSDRGARSWQCPGGGLVPKPRPVEGPGGAGGVPGGSPGGGIRLASAGGGRGTLFRLRDADRRPHPGVAGVPPGVLPPLHGGSPGVRSPASQGRGPGSPGEPAPGGAPGGRGRGDGPGGGERRREPSG
jgi:hypothetical protein